MKAAASAGSARSTAAIQEPSPLNGWSGMFTAVPGARDAAPLVDEARSREQRLTRLVDRERQHLRVVPEERLRAVAVVDVEVHVQNPVTGVACPGHGQCHVVVDAEARSATLPSRDGGRRRG